jgi:hypothetical protein
MSGGYRTRTVDFNGFFQGGKSCCLRGRMRYPSHHRMGFENG